MIYKFNKFFVNYEKEEKWLNDMAAKGFNLVSFKYPCRYSFKEGIPGEFIYRLELLNNTPGNPESKKYISFMEDTGVEFVDSYFRWVYFRKKASEGPFDLYSDISSRKNHYKRIAWLMGGVGIPNILIGLVNFFIGIFTPGIGHFNTYISFINLILGAMLCGYFATVIKKIRILNRENQIRE